MKYDKLVRDRIPEIIAAKGRAAMTHVADEAEYWQKLREKLREEVEEFLADESAAEIADILEVIDAICTHKGIDLVEVEQIKTQKAVERGRFASHIILEEA